MSYPTMNVAIYGPTDRRDPDHWAIYIDDQSGSKSIQQMVGKFGNEGYRVASIRYDTSPDRSSMWKGTIVVGALHSSRVAEARQLIQYQSVDNRSTTWNC